MYDIKVASLKYKTDSFKSSYIYIIYKYYRIYEVTFYTKEFIFVYENK